MNSSKPSNPIDAAQPGVAPYAAPQFWRSLAHRQGSADFVSSADREFPDGATESPATEATSRRTFLQLMGASLALASAASLPGCRRKETRIRAYQQKPEDLILGKPRWYATTLCRAGATLGVLVETHEGRPTKIEGHPLHLNSLGATDLYTQAAILDLYDPDRSRQCLEQGKPADYDKDILPLLAQLSERHRQNQGKGLAILAERDCSAGLQMLQKHMARTLPEARWYIYEPAQCGGLEQLVQQNIVATEQGARAETTLHLRQVGMPVWSKTIVAIDSDFLGTEDRGVAHKQDFAHGRAASAGEADGSFTPPPANRLYVFEPAMTLTGASADHRYAVAACHMPLLLGQLALALGVGHRNLSQEYQSLWPAKVAQVPGLPVEVIAKLAEDLKANQGQTAIVVGRGQPAVAHVLAMMINKHLDSRGVVYHPRKQSSLSAITELTGRLSKNDISTLLILGGNPAFNAPADLPVADLIAKVPVSIRLGLYEDETSAVCRWHIPLAHDLERWDVCRSGLQASIVQPMIDPLTNGKNPLEIVARLIGHPTTDGYQLARDAYAALDRTGDIVDWEKFIERGVGQITFVHCFPDAAISYAQVKELTHLDQSRVLSAEALEVRFVPDYRLFDGRYANNGWLQECPDPITKITWDNAALMSPKTAAALGIECRSVKGQTVADVIVIQVGERSLEAPVYVLPGCADWSITLPLGYGRRAGGSLATQTGFNAYALRTTSQMGFAVGATVKKTGKTYLLATTQEHWAVAAHHLGLGDEQAHERGLIRQGTRQEFAKDPAFAQKMGEHAPIHLSIYQSPKMDGDHQWGMVVDLSACVGCSACALACQAENNIPLVGKNEVIRGREMNWMRIDRYFTGDPDGQVSASFEPMMCQHCENAPCEPVCPVNATVHSPEGLNEMVYNRCIGTRYCSNNCPYKVRRFNFFDYNKGSLRQSGHSPFDGQIQPRPQAGFSQPQLLQPAMQELLKMQNNPDVTVRMRGVMEKCTYCVQRIQEAKIAAKSKVGQQAADGGTDERAAVKIADGAVRTACQQVCPTSAITFGDLADPQSKVAQLQKKHHQQLGYFILEHLNVRPRTMYLAQLKNPHPALDLTPPNHKEPA